MDFDLTALMEREGVFKITRVVDCLTGKSKFHVELNGGGAAWAGSVADALEQAKLPTAYKVPA